MTRLQFPAPDDQAQAHREVLLSELQAHEAQHRRLKRAAHMVTAPAPVTLGEIRVVNLNDLELLLIELHVLRKALGRVNGGVPVIHAQTQEAIKRVARIAGLV